MCVKAVNRLEGTGILTGYDLHHSVNAPDNRHIVIHDEQCIFLTLNTDHIHLLEFLKPFVNSKHCRRYLSHERTYLFPFMLPIMKKSSSKMSSHFPVRMASTSSSTSSIFTNSPGIPVKFSATNIGCVK